MNTLATAVAHPNIAFIKYWGNNDDLVQIPSNSSLSMNLDGLKTSTTVSFNTNLADDSLEINQQQVKGVPLERVSRFLDIVRHIAGEDVHAQVSSENNFPMRAGIASSASAFAALATASSQALGLDLPEKDLSRLARRGSGSACRSIPTGIVEWQGGSTDLDSYAVSIAPPDYWDLVDCIAVTQTSQKLTSSLQGHLLAWTSPLQSARVADAPRRIDICRKAILERDFETFAQIVELDSNLMHAVMMTCHPPLFYWEPASLLVMKTVPEWRKQGIPACYTVDAGANVHVITTRHYTDQVQQHLYELKGISQVLIAGVGHGTLVVPQDNPGW